jgi:phosphotransferase system IIB component
MSGETTTVDKYASTAHELITLLGGASNVRAVQHCVTRLRLKLADHDVVDDLGLRDHPAVLGRLRSDEGLHLIVGPAAAAPLAEACHELATLS